MSAFDDLGLKHVIGSIIQQGFTAPTSIQSLVLPQVQHSDLIGLAQTGSGKTAAYVWPILEALVEKRANTRPQALVLAPTRELAIQIEKEFEKYGSPLGITVGRLVGKQNAEQTAKSLNATVLVATLGKLHTVIGDGFEGLSNIEFLVLDEFDQLLKKENLPDLIAIRAACPALDKRRTLLFSATISEAIKQEAKYWMSGELTLSADNQQPVQTLEHEIIKLEPNLKFAALCQLLRSRDQLEGKTIVFFNHKKELRKVAAGLEKQGITVTKLTGSMGPQIRIASFEEFSAGSAKILLASDLMQRGIDVPEIELVISYDLHPSQDAYIHRSGRTARAGRSGKSIILLTPQDEAVLAGMAKRLPVSFVERSLPGLVEIPLQDDMQPSVDNLIVPEGRHLRLPEIIELLNARQGAVPICIVAKAPIYAQQIYGMMKQKEINVRLIAKTKHAPPQVQFDKALEVGQVSVFLTDLETFQDISVTKDTQIILRGLKPKTEDDAVNQE